MREPLPSHKLFLSVVIPIYNEQERLPKTLPHVLAYLAAQAYSYEVVIVDDGSSDQSLTLVRQIIEDHNQKSNVHMITTPHKGKAVAVRIGMLTARGRYRLYCDADLSTSIEEVEKLLPFFDLGYDMVIGSREGPRATRRTEPAYRYLMSRGFNLIVGLLLHELRQFRDTQCGFKMMCEQVARDLFSRVRLYGEHSKKVRGPRVTGFDVELLFLAVKRRYRVKEVGVKWYHVPGHNTDPWKDPFRLLSDVVRICWNKLCGRYEV